MNAIKILKEIMTNSNVSNAKLGARIGVSNAAIFERLKKKNIGVNVLIQMLSALDYELVIQPKGNKKTAGSYLVEKGLIEKGEIV